MADDKNKKPEAQSVTLTKEDLQELVTMSSMAAAQAMAQQLKPQVPTDEQLLAKVEAGSQCRDCGQVRRACKGKHRQVVVFPRNEDRARFFQGIIINGITYKSEHGGQPVIVPADADIEHMLATWEKQEDILITGRKAQHNSGSIGKAGTNGYVPAVGGWR